MIGWCLWKYNLLLKYNLKTFVAGDKSCVCKLSENRSVWKQILPAPLTSAVWAIVYGKALWQKSARRAGSSLGSCLWGPFVRTNILCHCLSGKRFLSSEGDSSFLFLSFEYHIYHIIKVSLLPNWAHSHPISYPQWENLHISNYNNLKKCYQRLTY